MTSLEGRILSHFRKPACQTPHQWIQWLLYRQMYLVNLLSLIPWEIDELAYPGGALYP